MPKLNKAGIDLIKSFEGWRAKAYRDAVGVWTIGYGHTDMTGNPPKVTSDLRITREEGEEILRRDLLKYESAVIAAVLVPLNDNQYSALVSFCYNVGPGNLRKSSILKRVNASRFDDVPGRLLLWNKAGGRVLRGLTRRRKAEGELFLKPLTTVQDHHERDEPVGKSVTPERRGLLRALVDLIASLFTGGKP
jgi:lysozyme